MARRDPAAPGCPELVAPVHGNRQNVLEWLPISGKGFPVVVRHGRRMRRPLRPGFARVRRHGGAADGVTDSLGHRGFVPPGPPPTRLTRSAPEGKTVDALTTNT